MSTEGIDPQVESALFARLDSAFEVATAPWTRTGAPCTLLFSGGVDSGLLAWQLRQNLKVILSTIGGRGSPDLTAARDSAALLGGSWVPSEVTEAEIRVVAGQVQPEISDLPRTGRSVLIALATAIGRASPGAVLCGQGADELFLGYAHFRGLGAADAASRSETDLRQLLERDWPRSQRIADRMGRTLVAPYLHPRFVEAARSIPVEHRLAHPTPKWFFRAWARHRGLPAAIAGRPKRALQFGSGVDRWVPPFERSRTRRV